MEHIPEPWAVYPPEFSNDRRWTVQTDSGMTIVICGEDTPENHKTAKLVAAAPKMLAALKCLHYALAVSWPEDMKEWALFKEGLLRVYAMMAGVANEAIVAAEGLTDDNAQYGEPA